MRCCHFTFSNRATSKCSTTRCNIIACFRSRSSDRNAANGNRPRIFFTSPVSASFAPEAGVGLIRACVGRGDGTSNLILQGLERVRFTAFEQEAPFPIATINPLESDSESSVETEALAAKVLELYSKLKGNGRQLPAKVDRYLSDLGDPEMLADLVASTFINDPMRRQHILEELSVNQRLRLVIRYLSEEPGSALA